VIRTPDYHLHFRPDCRDAANTREPVDFYKTPWFFAKILTPARISISARGENPYLYALTRKQAQLLNPPP